MNADRRIEKPQASEEATWRQTDHFQTRRRAKREKVSRRELAEVTESPYQDSQHHDENEKAADGDHEGNLPAGTACLFGADRAYAQQDKQQRADKQGHLLRFGACRFGACRGRLSTPNNANSKATSSFEPTLIIFISCV